MEDILIFLKVRKFLEFWIHAFSPGISVETLFCFSAVIVFCGLVVSPKFLTVKKPHSIMGENYNLSVYEELGESEENWEKAVVNLRGIAGSIGWEKTLQILEKVLTSVKPDSEKKVTAEEVIKALDQAGKSRTDADKGAVSYSGKYGFSGGPDL